MDIRKRSYARYSIGVAVAWAILLLVTRLVVPAHRWDTILTVFGGFVIGWLSATIARFVYPPPNRFQ